MSVQAVISSGVEMRELFYNFKTSQLRSRKNFLIINAN